MNEHDHPEGLAHDLPLIFAPNARRTALRWLAGGAVASALPAALIACGGGSDDTSSTSSTDTSSTSSSSSTGSTTTTTSGDTCSLIPSETSGPYPGDGTNSTSSGVVNVLTQTGIVRSDIRTSFNGLSGTAAGVPLTVTLQLVNANASCADLAGYAVYMWHCDRDGNYSLYTVTNQNYLRGIQVSDSSGKVTFTTIFPACYSGRWPHIHFEIYSSLAVATGGNNSVKTSQLALPAAACKQVYGVATGYDASVANLAAVSLASDLVFSDDSAAKQIPTVTGDVNNGFVAALQVGLSI
jgi:protocatechuate 3,4-dioxygenase beta subunit